MQNPKTEYGSDQRMPVALPEMEQLLPPLSAEQFSALEKDILENGCYSPIVVNEDMVIIDGHNRFRICEKHKLPYKMLVFSFADLLEAKQWALDTQKGRRNLDKWELGKIALQLKPDIEARAMCTAGGGPNQIARSLAREQILCPAVYAYQKLGTTHTSLDTENPYHWTSSTIANMLENELYLGNTINMRFSSKSYKDKRKVEHPREECLVFEGTHPALVTQEIWDIVQRVRKNKRRRSNMDEQNKYSGLVVCADCGATMVLHRAHTMKPTQNNFTCRTYKKKGAEICSAHYIWECVLDEVVLEDLRRVTAMVRDHTREFAEYISNRQSAEIRKDTRRLEKELTAMRKCSAELDAIFKKLYEDRVLGHISVEQFQVLSSSYVEEQTKLTEEIPLKEIAIQRLRDTVSSTDSFISKAKRYTNITELTPELLRLFIQKIVVHEKSTKWFKKALQTIEIHYTDIGCISGDIPQDKENPRQEISA